ncbi:putative peptidyl-tRNA hydrolase PTRHD1 isoform X2 [Planococcus citri]|uniref:putative peptidyl-tRNA hydrolase PTRHD1 isoform X2 n=1 Tax=Planococcus citri TaxID=170843 RepID=UPI0031F76EE8
MAEDKAKEEAPGVASLTEDLKAVQMQSIIQYILIRGDLFRELNWSSGAVIAQACHASTACIATYLKQNDNHTVEYIADMENMHKVVLDVINEKEILKVSKALTENNILHTLWYEKPENIPTCIAVKPYPRNDLKKYLKKFKLFSYPILAPSSKKD